MRVLEAAVQSALVLNGPRGDADEMAEQLLATLDGLSDISQHTLGTVRPRVQAEPSAQGS